MKNTHYFFLLISCTLIAAETTKSRGPLDNEGFPLNQMRLNTGEVVKWPEPHSPPFPHDIFMLSKEQVSANMIAAGFGSVEGAEKISNFFRRIVSDPESEAQWIIIEALLSEQSTKTGSEFFLGLNSSNPIEKAAFQKYEARLVKFLSNIKTPSQDPFLDK